MLGARIRALSTVHTLSAYCMHPKLFCKPPRTTPKSAFKSRLLLKPSLMCVHKCLSLITSKPLSIFHHFECSVTNVFTLTVDMAVCICLEWDMSSSLIPLPMQIRNAHTLVHGHGIKVWLALLCKAKRQYLLTLQLSRCCLLVLHDRAIVC